MANFVMRCSSAIGRANLLIVSVYFVLWIPIYLWHPFFPPYTMDEVYPFCYVIENIIFISMIIAFLLSLITAIMYLFFKLPTYLLTRLFPRLDETYKKREGRQCLTTFASTAGKISFYSFIVSILLWICARTLSPWDNPNIISGSPTNYFDLITIVAGCITCLCSVVYALLKLFNAMLPYVHYWKMPLCIASLIFQLMTYMFVCFYCVFN